MVGRKVSRLRREGLLPANVFGKKVKSQAIAVAMKDFKEVFAKAGETGLINLVIEDKGKADERAVLVSNLQLDPVSDLVLHVDFHQVDLKEKVTAEIPVEVVGESPAEKQGLGTVVQYVHEVEIEALPTDLPENFVIDATALAEVDQAVFVKDLKFDKEKIEIKTDLESIIVKVEPPQKEEVIETPVAETPAEGEVPAEGETKEETGAKTEEKPQEK